MAYFWAKKLKKYCSNGLSTQIKYLNSEVKEIFHSTLKPERVAEGAEEEEEVL